MKERKRKHAQTVTTGNQEIPTQFKRRILNPDATSCWLNACLQLILIGLDNMKHPLQLNSELGKELLKIKNINYQSYDPTPVKDILVLAEDTRIAVRKSENMSRGLQKEELQRQLRNVDNLYLNLKMGQQCVRDFSCA